MRKIELIYTAVIYGTAVNVDELRPEYLSLLLCTSLAFVSEVIARVAI